MLEITHKTEILWTKIARVEILVRMPVGTVPSVGTIKLNEFEFEIESLREVSESAGTVIVLRPVLGD